MSLLSVVRALALNVGLPVPDVVATSPAREWAEALQMANEAGEELARRVDWGVLIKATTLTGDGVTSSFNMPPDFDRMAQGITMRAGGNIVRPLTQAEWASLSPAVGVPRYFKLDGRVVRLWPTPSDAATVDVTYISREWLAESAGYQNDEDFALLDEDLLSKALIVRWRRQKGMTYADEEAEYEAALADLARFDDRARF
jgi:hypothetical protein